MTTDYRALCAELLDALENAIRVIYHEDGTKHISTADTVIAKADAALAQPEPVGPTDEELVEAFDQAVAAFPPVHSEAESLSAVEYARELEIRKARAVLSRWGRPAITPVPVSERLPGPEDCDEAAASRQDSLDNSPAPAGGLVERVAGAQFGINPYRPGAEETLARAAILAVAKWLEREDIQAWAADRLREEVERG